jgi:SagB-type dehydrogenase family enzyme
MEQADRSEISCTVHDELVIDYVLDTDLVVDGRRQRECNIVKDGPPLWDEARPSLTLGTRVYLDEGGALHLCLPLGKPDLSRRLGVIIVRRRRREVVLADGLDVLWMILRLTNGDSTVAGIVGALPDLTQTLARRLLAILAITGVLELSDRPLGQFLHAATKKGFYPGGGLDLIDVLRLVTDGEHRCYPGTSRLPVDTAVPAELTEFHALTHCRRSRREYNGSPILRSELDAILATACGTTGLLEWAGRQLRLRAYPSSGGLYSTEVYPIVFSVEGLPRGLYHYCPNDNVLEVVSASLDIADVTGSALPTERKMLAGVAVLFFITAVFRRHERKYGEGGYRMLVAEAGHLSQNLVLAATSLGLDARPFGSFYDDLIHQVLGFSQDDEQFLLGVLVGHADDHLTSKTAPKGDGNH